jgi:hypothetical protein
LKFGRYFWIVCSIAWSKNLSQISEEGIKLKTCFFFP